MNDKQRGDKMDRKEAIAVLYGMKRELEYNLKTVKTAELTEHMKYEWKQQLEALNVAINEIKITIDNQ